MEQEIIGDESDRSKMFVLLHLMQQEYRENKASGFRNLFLALPLDFAASNRSN